MIADVAVAEAEVNVVQRFVCNLTEKMAVEIEIEMWSSISLQHPAAFFFSPSPYSLLSRRKSAVIHIEVNITENT